jgi:hypothetical protein
MQTLGMTRDRLERLLLVRNLREGRSRRGLRMRELAVRWRIIECHIDCGVCVSVTGRQPDFFGIFYVEFDFRKRFPSHDHFAS